TQMLPDSPVAQAAVAMVMGFADWPAFSIALQARRDTVSRHFSQVISSENDDDDTTPDSGEWQALWQGELPDEAALARLAAFADPGQALVRVTALRESAAVRVMQSMGRERLDQFMPTLLAMIAGSEMPD